MLPKSQLLAQWRELNSIYAKEDKHVLINYIYEYPKSDLLAYTELVLAEMRARGFNIRTFDKMERYFADVEADEVPVPYARHHDDTYLTICYYNLFEKFLRGQKDYSAKEFARLEKFYHERVKT